MLFLIVNAHLFHIGHYLLSKLNVVISHEVDFVFHSVNYALHEQIGLK